MPFSVEEFLKIFERYNLEVWPAQILLLLIGFAGFSLCFVRSVKSSQVTNICLVLLWLWMAVVYHGMYFSALTPSAYFFGFLFLLQGLLFLWFGVLKKKYFLFRFRYHYRVFLGLFFLLYAFVIYPILAYNFGHDYPQTPTFGVPCPTTIFTFGILMFAERKIPWLLLLIPFAWSLIGISAPINLGILEDLGLIITGIISFISLADFKRKRPLKLA